MLLCFEMWARQWIVGNLVTLSGQFPVILCHRRAMLKILQGLKYGQISVAAEQMTFYVND
jgi:hypothetical protein